jgi:dipeptidyl aminopeptidase/acylaminoacyl peptidase
MVSKDGEISSDRVLDIDRNVEGARWLDDERFIALLTDGTSKSIWVSDLDGNKNRIDIGNLVPNTFRVGKNGDIAIVGTSPHEPVELYYMSTVEADMTALTNVNTWADTLAKGEVITVEWETYDGFNADGVLTYPVGYEEGKTYPLVLVIHGGPMGSSKTQFRPMALDMASEGWLVFQPNYRGSNNLGNAYQRAVINDAGEGPGKDVMAGVDKLISMGIVDTSRMAVSGWSYGGYMTVWLTSFYDVWKAAVAGAAVTDWFDWYSMADLNIWSGLGLGGSPWINDNAENYRRQSPITYAHQIKTPTLILSNTYDERVTVSQSYKLFHNLKDNGVETQFIAYPLKGHFPGDPVNQMDVMERWVGWIKERI